MVKQLDMKLIHANHLLPSITRTVTRLCLVCQTGGNDVRCELRPFRVRSHVQQQHPRVLHHRFDLSQEGHRLSAVDQTVVVRQSHVHHRPDLHLNKTEDTHNVWEQRYRFSRSLFSKGKSHEENHTVTICDLKKKRLNLRALVRELQSHDALRTA